MPEYSVPVISDPYVGKVFGNILDFYDNPSYNLRLMMVKPEYATAFAQEDLFFTEKQIAPPADTVILAQTGTTGTQIDDVEISAIASDGGDLTASFTIIQPGAATFLDEIQFAKAYLGYDNSASTTLFLEIRFQGYTADSDNNDEGGVPEVILGPIIYKLSFNKFSLSLDASGSSYACECIIEDTQAYRDTVYRTPQTITTTGATITEHTEDFVTALREWHENTTAYQVPDKIEIDLSELIGTASDGGNSLSIISDDKLITSKDKGMAETVNRVMNETWEIRTKIEQQAALDADPVDRGDAPEIQFDGDNLSIKEGTSIYEFMYILLSMCPEFYTKCTRKENIDDPESKVKKDQAFVSWFRVHTKTERLEFDPSRNDYAYKYTYVPLLYKTANPNVAVDVEELNPELADIQERVKQFKANGSLLKAYGYFFTGINDQILGLDIKYDNGNGSMLPPKYGAIGEVAITSQNKFTDTSPEGESTAYVDRLDSVLGKAKEKAEKDIFGDFVDSVKSLNDAAESNNILGSIANQLGSVLGLSNNQILQKMADKAGLNELVEQANQVQRNLFNDLTINAATPSTEPPDVSSAGPVSGPYTPEPSGYVYSADFIPASTDNTLDAATLSELGYIPGAGVPPLPVKADASKDKKSKADAGTVQVGTTRNKLFGFITEQQNSANFLLEIDLELRGDPWYLASNDLSKPTESTANFKRDDTMFFLRIASPQKFDPDWRDEDSNTGYWKFDGTSRTFSGVYKILTVNNKFAGGQFSTSLRAIRTFGVDEPLSDVDSEESET